MSETEQSNVEQNPKILPFQWDIEVLNLFVCHVFLIWSGAYLRDLQTIQNQIQPK